MSNKKSETYLNYQNCRILENKYMSAFLLRLCHLLSVNNNNNSCLKIAKPSKVRFSEGLKDFFFV